MNKSELLNHSDMFDILNNLTTLGYSKESHKESLFKHIQHVEDAFLSNSSIVCYAGHFMNGKTWLWQTKLQSQTCGDLQYVISNDELITLSTECCNGWIVYYQQGLEPFQHNYLNGIYDFKA